MSKDIIPLYKNSLGIAFKWKYDLDKNRNNNIQMVFRDMGFYLTVKDIENFSNNVTIAQRCMDCNCCEIDKNGRYILLKTPSSKIDIAVSEAELKLINDLIQGTLFQLKLDKYIDQICKN